MNKKLGIGVVLVAIVVVAVFSGCVEKEEAPAIIPEASPSPMPASEVTPSPEPSPSVTPSPIESPSPEPTPTEIPEPEYTVNLYTISTVYADTAVGKTTIRGDTEFPKGTFLTIKLYKITDDEPRYQSSVSTAVNDEGEINKTIDVLGYGKYMGKISHDGKIYDTIEFEMKKSPVILEVRSTKVDKEKYINYYAVSGRVKNRGTATAESVKVMVRLYNDWGTLIGSDYIYTDIPDIPPDEESTFSLMIEKGDTLPYERYEVTTSYSRYSW